MFLIRVNHTVGIHSAEDLKNIGSKQAVFRLKEQYPNTCVVILYHLEAAIQGVEMKQLDTVCKSELKAYFKQI
ncbi:MAG: TfoX/Sxy family protein [Lachnospiraceae bacterium]|nr:TfoX/Sxy family protein [Lachnospiraceae bacterium]